MNTAPWEWLENDDDMHGLAYVLESHSGEKLIIADEHRRRIVACVKCCKGFTTKELEDMGEGGMLWDI